jgi:hypothetical protein
MIASIQLGTKFLRKSCGLKDVDCCKNLWLQLCVDTVQSNSCLKSCRYAVVEVLPSSCGISIADIIKLRMLTSDLNDFFFPLIYIFWLDKSKRVSVNSSGVSVNSCRVSVNSCRVSVNSCRVSVNSRWVSVNSCRVSVNSCRVSVNICRVCVNSYRVSVNSCRVSVNIFRVGVNSCK